MSEPAPRKTTYKIANIKSMVRAVSRFLKNLDYVPDGRKTDCDFVTDDMEISFDMGYAQAMQDMKSLIDGTSVVED